MEEWNKIQKTALVLHWVKVMLENNYTNGRYGGSKYSKWKNSGVFKGELKLTFGSALV